MNFKKSLFIILISAVCPFLLYSQVKNIGLPDIKNFKKSEYKGSTQNWDIEQDKNGNLYFANNNGLLKYDGSSWSKYNTSNSIEIRSLKIDNSGKIFVGCYNEFGYFKSNAKGKLEYFSISKNLSKDVLKDIEYIWKIHIINKEVIFQSFARVFIYKEGKVTTIEAPNRLQFSFIVNNHLYLQDMNLGILEYKNGKLYTLKNATTLNNTEIWGMFPLPDNKILITTIDKGLFIYDHATIQPWNTEVNNFIKKNSSLGGASIGDKFIALNTVLNGIIICDLKGNIIQHINRKKGLQNNTVLTSFLDNNKNLWLGLDNGITFVNENSPFTYFGFSYNLSTVYNSIIFKDYLYVATNQGVFYHSWKMPFTETAFQLVEGTTGQAWNLQIIDNQLFCAHNRGALLINENKTVTTLDNNGYWNFKLIPSNPNFIIGANYSGLSIFEKTTKGWKYRNQLKGYDKSTNVIEIDKNRVWFKKGEFVYKLKLSDDLKKINIEKKYKNINNTGKYIESIRYLKNSIYFIADNHFYKYYEEDDAFYEDKKTTALFKNVPKIRSLREDDQGNIWYLFSESLGVLMKDKKGNYKNVVAPFTNLTGNLVYQYESVYTIDNNIFIGLTDGLAHYDATLISNRITKPKAYLRSFSFPKDTLFLGNMPQPLKEYAIPYKSNNVIFTFSTPTYENIENIEYSYQLENFDNSWSNWSTTSIKEYTNLHEGNYKMKLKVRNSFGIVSDQTSFKFSISPPWYRHFLAYLFYLVLLFVAFYFIRIQIRMKIRKNKYFETVEQRRIYLEKETRIKQEQYELEKEIERLENEKLQIKILSKDKELVNNTLQVVKKNKILNGIIHKLKDIDTNALDESTKFQFTKLNKSISKEVGADKSWKDLEKHVKNVHYDFLKRLKQKHPTISPRELDLSTYLLMNMSTKEIAEIMNISTGGVELARYRLRKKLELNKKENLIGFLLKI